jgi:formate-dependent nitrite reductase cytochrome c552 subunit
MKNLKLVGLLIIVASSLLFIQCTSDVITGPQGLAGIDGTDGTNGTDGTDGTDGVDGVDGVGAASCITCHSDSHREPIESSYAQSDHANQSIMYDGRTLAEYTNRTYCAECHVSQGHVEFLETGAVAAVFDAPEAISCETCHDKHGTFDFENDGYDYALRSFDPVPLRKVNADYVIDYGDKSNACITCHQPRTIPRLDADEAGVEDGLIEVPNRYGPHYGAQSIMLEGIYGAEIAGTTSYPTAVSSAHRNGASCVSCHMGEPNEGDGQHSMVPTFAACTNCHGDGAETLMTNLQTEVDGYMAELEVLFTAQGLLDAEGNLVYNVDYPATVADAYWNYKMVYYDHSKGVHNPAYTRAMLKNAIEAVEAL